MKDTVQKLIKIIEERYNKVVNLIAGIEEEELLMELEYYIYTSEDFLDEEIEKEIQNNIYAIKTIEKLLKEEIEKNKNLLQSIRHLAYDIKSLLETIKSKEKQK